MYIIKQPAKEAAFSAFVKTAISPELVSTVISRARASGRIIPHDQLSNLSRLIAARGTRELRTTGDLGPFARIITDTHRSNLPFSVLPRVSPQEYYVSLAAKRRPTDYVWGYNRLPRGYGVLPPGMGKDPTAKGLQMTLGKPNDASYALHDYLMERGYPEAYTAPLRSRPAQ